MRKLFVIIIFLSSPIIILAQNELVSNSLEYLFNNSSVSYRYIEDKQIHDYSDNWDIDGDGIKDNIMFIGNGGAHLYFSLFIKLSSGNKDYDFKYLLLDCPLLEPIDSLLKHGRQNIFPQFVVHDFNGDGVSDIFVNIDSTNIQSEELQALGITSNHIILYYDIKNNKIVIEEL
jgi:hypothetical protein